MGNSVNPNLNFRKDMRNKTSKFPLTWLGDRKRLIHN